MNTLVTLLLDIGPPATTPAAAEPTAPATPRGAAGARSAPPATQSPPRGYRVRPCRRTDIEALGRLYFEAYDPGQACASLAEAIADIEASFAGQYGELWPDASLVATGGDDRLTAAVLVVHQAPWPDTPHCPFVIELFSARDHRRRGLARCLLQRAVHVVTSAGRDRLALRVADDNTGARALYHSLGFQQWHAR